MGKEIISEFDYSGMKPMEKSKIDPIINNMLKKKTFSRKSYFQLMGLIISALGIFMGSLSLSLNWQLFVPGSVIDFFNVVPVILSTFGIVFIGSMFIGEKNKAVKMIVGLNAVFAVFLIFVFDNFLSQIFSQYFGNIGSWYVYLIFIVLITFTSALFGSLQTERKYLFPE